MIDLPPKKKPDILRITPLPNNALFEIESVSLRFSNGVEREFTRIHNLMPPAVLIVPLLDAETMLLIREYGVGVEDYSLGFPKGALEPKESVLEGANRELMEEVGYGAKQLQWIKTFSTSPSYMSSRMHLVIASELYPQSLSGDEPESIEVVPWKLSEADALLEREDFHEARSIAALLMLMRKRDAL